MSDGIQAMAKDDKSKEEEGNGNVRKYLFESRQIFLTGAVNERVARAAMTDLLALEAADPKKPITLILNSPGGSVSDGYAIYDTIRFIQPTVKIVTTGLCASIATVILAAAERKYRACTPNTRLLIHQPHIPMQVYGPASDLEITAKEILKTRGKINALLAEACNQPIERVERDTQRDYWMSAEEAVEYGLVATIVRSREELEAL
jgi:ATP-dependent Clp protease protease subunit